MSDGDGDGNKLVELDKRLIEQCQRDLVAFLAANPEPDDEDDDNYEGWHGQHLALTRSAQKTMSRAFEQRRLEAGEVQAYRELFATSMVAQLSPNEFASATAKLITALFDNRTSL